MYCLYAFIAKQTLDQPQKGGPSECCNHNHHLDSRSWCFSMVFCLPLLPYPTHLSILLNKSLISFYGFLSPPKSRMPNMGAFHFRTFILEDATWEQNWIFDGFKKGVGCEKCPMTWEYIWDITQNSSHKK